MRFEIIHPDELVHEDFMDLKRALECGEGTLEEVLESAHSGHCQIWRMEDEGARGVVVTQVYAKRSTLFVWLISGEGGIKRIPLCLEVLKDFAADNGLRTITSLSNKGMARVLHSHGFGVKWYSMELEVPNGRTEQ